MEREDIDLTWGVKIPMRDGIKLNATVYKPKKTDDPLPGIFTLTPYISDNYHARAYDFSQKGYVVLLVDSRGRGNSQGEFHPNLQEGLDGHNGSPQDPVCSSGLTEQLAGSGEEGRKGA